MSTGGYRNVGWFYRNALKGKNREIKINDVTLREGDQAPLTSFNKKEKQICLGN